MKKLTVLLQIIGFLAICPTYVVLEMTHTAKEKTETVSDSFINPTNEIRNTPASPAPINKTQSTSAHFTTKQAGI